ncbi:hypothetical protein AVEN_65510-1 [Araneus ventricosus]|uniref:Uncharacterized protein n=1 Tax=Araneus ventricosus TaxID=182803 RepID=A0A4Y2FFR6_ARAVE|nr:hypothetical protein AVEN_65510-1 [Araneus ventricosus]
MDVDSVNNEFSIIGVSFFEYFGFSLSQPNSLLAASTGVNPDMSLKSGRMATLIGSDVQTSSTDTERMEASKAYGNITARNEKDEDSCIPEGGECCFLSGLPDQNSKIRPNLLKNKSKGFEKGQISIIWPQKGQYGNPASSARSAAASGSSATTWSSRSCGKENPCSTSPAADYNLGNALRWLGEKLGF